MKPPRFNFLLCKMLVNPPPLLSAASSVLNAPSGIQSFLLRSSSHTFSLLHVPLFNVAVNPQGAHHSLRTVSNLGRVLCFESLRAAQGLVHARDRPVLND